MTAARADSPVSELTKAPHWSSQFAVYLGTIGAAVGLGSIWRFPYLAGTLGGGAFIGVFVLACLFIATPLLVAEYLIGRYSGLAPSAAAGAMAVSLGRSRRWNIIGQLGTIAAFLICSYYTIVAGWVVAYTWKCSFGRVCRPIAPGTQERMAALSCRPVAADGLAGGVHRRGDVHLRPRASARESNWPAASVRRC